MFLEQRGWTVFDNQRDPVPILDWRVDDHIRNILLPLVSSRFQIHDLPGVPAGLADCTGTYNCSRLLPKTAEFDAYILVSKSVSQGFGGGGGEFTGIGVFHVPGLIGRGKAVSHVIYQITIVDAHTGHVIEAELGKLPDTVFGGEHAWPVSDLDISVWPEKARTLSKEQEDAIHRSTMSLIDESLPYTAKQLGL
jgi:hypothetical protein